MRRGRIVVGIALLILATAIPHVISATPRVNAAARIIDIAQNQIGKDFRMGATGPDKFDCSGLVYYAFSRAGVYERLFGERRFLAREYLAWGREHHALSTTNPRVGDLILWTHRGTDKVVHMGIYVGTDNDGHALALSALTTGVRIHRLNNIVVDFLTYVHTGLSGMHGEQDTPPASEKGPIPSEEAQPAHGALDVWLSQGSAASGGRGNRWWAPRP